MNELPLEKYFFIIPAFISTTLFAFFSGVKSPGGNARGKCSRPICYYLVTIWTKANNTTTTKAATESEFNQNTASEHSNTKTVERCVNLADTSAASSLG